MSMDLKLTGNIVAVLPVKSGTSAKGQEWQVQEYVLQTDGEYPHHLCFSMFGADKIQQNDLHEGDNITVIFDVDAHEYNGRWFNSIRAWKIDKQTPAQSQPAKSVTKPATPPPAPAEEVGEELPF